MMRLNGLLNASAEVRKRDRDYVTRYQKIEAYKEYIRSRNGHRNMDVYYDQDYMKAYVSYYIVPAFKSEALR